MKVCSLVGIYLFIVFFVVTLFFGFLLFVLIFCFLLLRWRFWKMRIQVERCADIIPIRETPKNVLHSQTTVQQLSLIHIFFVATSARVQLQSTSAGAPAL